MEKTKAVWIGRNHNSNVKWCENENLDWCKINFDNNLENMDNNFYEKIDKIDRFLNGWLYRYLTPLGKFSKGC